MRLISADELTELYDGCDGLSVPIAVVRQNIEDAPTIDAEPVRHGHWIKMTDSDGDYYCCSNCGEELPRYSCTFPTPTKPFPLMKSVDKTNYCPNCGAKMDGKDNT